MRIAFHAAAEKETQEVADYYDLQLPGLGAEFYHELDTILDLLDPNPWMGGRVFRPVSTCDAATVPVRGLLRGRRQPDQDRGRRTPTQIAGILERP